MSYLDMPLGEIVTQVPGATAVLFKHEIDFCSNGEIPLKTIIKQQGLNADDIVTTVEALAIRSGATEDLSKANNKKLIAHILTRYHKVHHEQLTEMIRLADCVEIKHGSNKLCPNGLSGLLVIVKQELEHHMKKEKTALFPMLSKSHSPMLSGLINVMMAEHKHHIKNLDKIYTLTNDLFLPSEACNTWRALYLGLKEFIRDVHKLIHIENNILFARSLKKDVVARAGSGYESSRY